MNPCRGGKRSDLFWRRTPPCDNKILGHLGLPRGKCSIPPRGSYPGFFRLYSSCCHCHMTSTIICLPRCHESALSVFLFRSNWGRASKCNNWASRNGPQLLGNIQLLGFAFLDWLDWMGFDEVEDEIEWNWMEVMRLRMRLNGNELWKLKSEDWFGKSDPESRPKKSLVTESRSFTLIFCETQV